MQGWRVTSRLAAAVLGVVAALAWSGIGFAHVDVEANPDIAGSTDAVVTFTAEAESTSAGISAVEVALPAGITAQDIALNKAPAGWTLATTANGYRVSGAALPQGEEAQHSIIVTRLPNVNELVFKTLVTYSNGDVDRWIEEKSTANPNPENPAPVLTLKPGPSDDSGPGPSSPVTTSVTPSSPTTTPAAAPTDGGSDYSWMWWVAGALVLGAVVGYLARRRSSAP
jgi:hypothetical protein